MDGKRRATKASVVKLIELLAQAVNTPSEFSQDDPLREAVKTQVKLAAYCNEERDIVGCSLNTFKALASTLGEGFSGVEALRVEAEKSLSRRPRARVANSRRDLQEKKANLEKIIASQDRDLQQLSLVISEMKSLCNQLVDLDLIDRRAYYELEISRINQMLQQRRK
ncbi:MAG: hypothetical protein ACN6P2_11915 [Pseudomonas palmensis]|uniref:hypothetical protein n=1 Tax=Pseudomonas palmensis TaxID=2815362 RepID=UPI003D1207ED